MDPFGGAKRKGTLESRGPEMSNYLDQISSTSNVMHTVLTVLCSSLQRLELRVEDYNSGLEAKTRALEQKLENLAFHVSGDTCAKTLRCVQEGAAWRTKKRKKGGNAHLAALIATATANATATSTAAAAPSDPSASTSPRGASLITTWAVRQVMAALRRDRRLKHAPLSTRTPSKTVRLGCRVSTLEGHLGDLQEEIKALRLSNAQSRKSGRQQQQEIQLMRAKLLELSEGASKGSGSVTDKVVALESRLGTLEGAHQLNAHALKKLRMTEERVGFTQEQVMTLQQGLSGVRLNIRELHGALITDHELLVQLEDFRAKMRAEALGFAQPATKVAEAVQLTVTPEAPPPMLPPPQPVQQTIVVQQRIIEQQRIPDPRASLPPGESDQERSNRLCREALVALRDLSVDIDSSMRTATGNTTGPAIQALRELSGDIGEALGMAAAEGAQAGKAGPNAKPLVPKFEAIMLRIEEVLVKHKLEVGSGAGDIGPPAVPASPRDYLTAGSMVGSFKDGGLSSPRPTTADSNKGNQENAEELQGSAAKPVGGLGGLRCASGAQDMPARLEWAQAATAEAIAAGTTAGESILRLLHMRGDVDAARSCRGDVDACSRKLAALASLLVDFESRHGRGRSSGTMIGMSAAAMDVTQMALKADTAWEDKKQVADLRIALSTAMSQLEKMHHTMGTKADSNQLDAALKVVNSQLRKITSDVMPKEKLEGYLRTKVDRKDLHKLAAVLSSAVDVGAMNLPDLDSSAAATKSVPKFKCLSCDRPLPSANDVHAPSSQPPSGYMKHAPGDGDRGFGQQLAAGLQGSTRVPLSSRLILRETSSSATPNKVEADLQQLPQGTQRTQALARFRSQRHMHSIGMAFLNEPMCSTTASFDGLSWQLAVKRAIGAHDTIVHNSVKRATQRILRQYLKTGLVDEDYTPFLGSAGPPGSRRMDIVLPADAFPVTGYDDPTRHLPLMVDVTCFEAQVASRAAKTAADPERCCRDQEAARLSHYSGHYDQNCHKLATLAIGSFGSIGEQGRKLLEAVATEYASRMSVPGGARPKALKGIALARLRSALSAALHMAYSGRVMTHMAESRGGGHMEGGVGEDPEMPFGGGGV
ncbi:hypothetical protein JKP88DRAFT_282094 [Tribonema minus]|uniref:Uncharacterized protein n=1 Tax=Tribonema minus TaxID=303371 RepID=A0A835YKY1_9STRA|nr:hypothetical protein JKP88DRAFT_282094 [Tribonema minus]